MSLQVSVRFNRLGSLGSSIYPAQIHPLHQKKTEACLKKIIDKHLRNHPEKKIPLRLRFRPEQPVLEAGNREIRLPKSPELQEMDRIVRYYQNIGRLPKPCLSPKEEKARVRECEKSVQAINEASMPGNNGSLLAGMRLADDTLSVVRNAMNLLPAFGPNDPVVKHLGYYAGIFWTFFALRELDDGVREQKRSKEIKDAEGLQRARSRLLSGTIVAAGSLAYLASKVNDTFGATAVSLGLSAGANILFGAGSLLAIGASLSGVLRCNRFANRLNEYLQNPSITETERMLGAIRFLKDSISITADEKEALARQIEKEHPDWSLELKEQCLSQRLADLTEVKVRYLKRRTSNKSLRLIIEKSDAILKKLEDPGLNLEGIRDAIFLIHIVQKENKIKTTLYFLGFIAACLSFIAMLISASALAGFLPFVLYGIAGTIYLGITIYSISGRIFLDHNVSKLCQSQETPFAASILTEKKCS